MRQNISGADLIRGLIDRVRETPFAQFFQVDQLNFSPVIIHGLLQRKVHPTERNEIQFGLGNVRVRFGRSEYALITGLSWGDGPTAAEEDAHLGGVLLREQLSNQKNVGYSLSST